MFYLSLALSFKKGGGIRVSNRFHGTPSPYGMRSTALQGGYQNLRIKKEF